MLLNDTIFKIGDKVKFEISLSTINDEYQMPRWNFEEDGGRTGKQRIGEITNITNCYIEVSYPINDTSVLTSMWAFPVPSLWHPIAGENYPLRHIQQAVHSRWQNMLEILGVTSNNIQR